MSSADCCVCLEQLSTSETITLPCTHVFHAACARTWLRAVPVCPLCRLPVTRDGSAEAPPPEDAPPFLRHLFQALTEGFHEIMAQQLRPAEADSLTNSFPNEEVSHVLTRLLADMFSATAQSNSSQRSIEARFSLRAIIPTSPPSSSPEPRDGEDPAAPNETVPPETSRNPSNNRDPAHDTRFFISFVEVSEHAGSVMLLERVGLTGQLSSSRRNTRRLNTPRRAELEAGSRASRNNSARPEPSPRFTPAIMIDDNSHTEQQTPQPNPASNASASADAAAPNSSTSSRRLASKFMSRRTRSRENRDTAPETETVREETVAEADQTNAPDHRSFASFRRWLRGSLRRAPAGPSRRNVDR